MNNSQASNRLEYLDALRGMAMLFVIYFHILAYSGESDSTVNDYIIRWRMPLFFFISGFFAAFRNYDSNVYKKRISNRLSKQLYPTIIILSVFIVVSWLIGSAPLKEYVLHGIYDPAKLGYWFTISLVEVYLIYTAISAAMFFVKIDIKKQGMACLLISVVSGLIYIFFLRSYSPEGILLKFYSVLSIAKFSALITFFFLGVFCRIYETGFIKILSKPYVTLVSLGLFLVLSLLSQENYQIDSFIYYGSRVFGLMTVVSIFVCGKKYFDSTTAAGRYLIRIGRNTLPIYLFHFFMIIMLPVIVTDFVAYKDQLSLHWYIELPVVLLISAFIAEVCMLIDRVLKAFPKVYCLTFNPAKLLKQG